VDSLHQYLSRRLMARAATTMRRHGAMARWQNPCLVSPLGGRWAKLGKTSVDLRLRDSKGGPGCATQPPSSRFTSSIEIGLCHWSYEMSCRAEWRHVSQREPLFETRSRHVRDERSLGWENCDVQAHFS